MPRRWLSSAMVAHTRHMIIFDWHSTMSSHTVKTLQPILCAHEIA